MAQSDDNIQLEGASTSKPTTAIDHPPANFLQPFDPENPLDWPLSRKWLVTDIISATGLNRIMVSTILAPALPAIAKEMAMSSTEEMMALSIYLLATAFGPLVIGPLSEVYGRQLILHASSVWFLVWNIVCGCAETKGTLLAARFLAGFGASAVYSLAGGVLNDIWRPEQRGKSLGVYLLIPLLGAAIGPILGGVIVANTTWRWIFWSTSIFQALMMGVSVFSFQETYAPEILRRRARRLNIPLEKRSMMNFTKALTRPVRFLLFHPIIQVSVLLSAFDYGILYITLSTFSSLWTSVYHQSVQISGLHYIACSLGEVIGSQVGGFLMDRLYMRPRRHTRPEARLPLEGFSMAIAALGLVFYGWAAHYKLYWVVVDVAVTIMMVGLQMFGMPVSGYIIDSYGEHTSSAMASLQFGRSLSAFLLPLFAPKMYQVLGYGWANSVLASAGLLMLGLVWVLWRYGPQWREKLVV
ncbi:hypothetical protein ASPZODRAFT_76735 [Penicilliopsis zonata CBS 506.65]|uniref:Major facilitator superfamily (MFS) profile domain-containing protein n=1 Tax=Penicilliopsis zonata CBS 506.65 TaxID=1073090 RepID=A0A1L9S5K3_9EURO|nr:hypothetical protein ASPZODRAFT_76735 [Penicilliopsis zonata CBS 506.65]OJJ42441.1 hypothetical protein ASPZODRAFT_76735 [Penicilliopsis zonata CBS 506.65]